MELSLDLSLDFVPKTIPQILVEVSSIADCSTKRSKLDDYVKRLEDEMRKIDAFKRELPLCVLLLKDAILRLKEESVQFQSLEDQPVIEEFIPLKGNSDGTDGESEEEEDEEKKKWLSSAQLWNMNFNFDYKKQNSNSNTNLNSEEDDRSVPENPMEHWDFGRRRRAFELFKDQSNFARTATKEDIEFSEVPKLTLMTSISDQFPDNLSVKTGGGGGRSGRAVSGLSSPAAQMKGQSKLSQQQQTIRKQRRCWSPELHRRFVDALHRLGGSQVATPKQIRELMQVDGLTNDEVKSHLQKYRLHVRKLTPSETPGGDLWMSQEHSKTSITHAGSPDGPLHTGGSAKALSITEGDSMDAEEDAKSDGHSWKGRIQKLGDV